MAKAIKVGPKQTRNQGYAGKASQPTYVKHTKGGGDSRGTNNPNKPGKRY